MCADVLVPAGRITAKDILCEKMFRVHVAGVGLCAVNDVPCLLDCFRWLTRLVIDVCLQNFWY